MCEEIRKKLTKKIHPLKQVYIHHVKVLKRPKMDKNCKAHSFIK